MRDKINDPARLELMKESIGNIEEFLAEVKTPEKFKNNKVLCHAVIYNLQCIISSHPQMDWDAIEGLRHVLVHDYYQVDMDTIWGIIQQDLPKLKSFLNQ